MRIDYSPYEEEIVSEIRISYPSREDESDIHKLVKGKRFSMKVLNSAE